MSMRCRFAQVSCRVFLVSIVTLAGLPALSHAHARWVLNSVTPPRSGDTGLKIEPCGGKARTMRTTIFSAGQTIDVQFEETINHPGHYRIAFSPADDLNFDSNVLVDNIPDTTNTGSYTQTITIPAQVCTACTLQLIQVMTTSPTPQAGDFYYSCSDIQITEQFDTTAPNAVGNVQAGAADGRVALSWENPAADYYRVVVLQSTSPILDAPVNGEMYAVGDMINSTQVIYAGSGSWTTATGLTNNSEYYFKVFAQNPRKNYAGGVEASAIPVAGTPVNGGGTGSNGGGTSNSGSGTSDSGSGGDAGKSGGGSGDGSSGSGSGGGGGGMSLLFLFSLFTLHFLVKGSRVRDRT